MDEPADKAILPVRLSGLFPERYLLVLHHLLPFLLYMDCEQAE